MTYTEIINIIDNKRRFGNACGRDVTKVFLKALGHPDRGKKIIHIAGTNGKGSVAAFVSSILRAASFSSDNHFKVGLFTSPHLISHRERIQIDGVQISEADVVRLGGMLLDMELKIEPTMFDYWLVMALLYFKENDVEYIVLETGLGGRKDSTNGLSQYPLVCAITSIGLEHTRYLGDTIQKIASEKAGIIKENVPVVIGQMDDEASSVIISRCGELNAGYQLCGEVSAKKQLGLKGKYQRLNAAVAEGIVRYLDIDISEDIIADGLRNAWWPGRMQIISDNPFIMIDGAHNPLGVRKLYESLVDESPNESFSFIMAVMADKDYMEMARIIGPIADSIFTVTIESDRAKQSEELAKELCDIGLNAKSCDSYQDALSEAKSLGNRIIVFGSLYFIGEVLHGCDNNETGGTCGIRTRC